MATDYAAYARLKAEARERFIARMASGGDQAAGEIFELLHDLRGDLILFDSHLVTDEYVEERIALVEAIVGPAYPQIT